jgi:hypothetical protein
VNLDPNNSEASVIDDTNSEVLSWEEIAERREAASLEAKAALIRKILLSIEMTPRDFIKLDNSQRSRVLAGDHVAVLAERGARL